jgi:hypothetical protein
VNKYAGKVNMSAKCNVIERYIGDGWMIRQAQLEYEKEVLLDKKTFQHNELNEDIREEWLNIHKKESDEYRRKINGDWGK